MCELERGNSDNSPVLSPPSHMRFVKLCQDIKEKSEAGREGRGVCVCVRTTRVKVLRMSGA